jgi:hypothetical protein
MSKGYELRYTLPDGHVYLLDPDHSMHQSNMDGLRPLERRILIAYLEETLKTLTTTTVTVKFGQPANTDMSHD